MQRVEAANGRDVMVSDSGSWTDAWDALCVTLTLSLGPGEAARLMALGEFEAFPDLSSAEAWVSQSETYDRAWFATGAVDDWTFVWEANGWQGVTPDVALRLADGGPLLSMFWNVNSVMSFLAMDGGQVVRQFDPLFHDEQPPTDDVGAPLSSESGLEWEEAPRLSGLALLSVLAGTAAVDPSWLSTSGTRFWGHRV